MNDASIRGYMMIRREGRVDRKKIPRPTKSISMKLKSEGSFGVIFSWKMKITQFVNVPNVHLTPIDLFLVKLEEVDGTRHSLVSILIPIHYCSIIKKKLQEFGNRVDKIDSLFPPEGS